MARRLKIRKRCGTRPGRRITWVASAVLTVVLVPPMSASDRLEEDRTLDDMREVGSAWAAWLSEARSREGLDPTPGWPHDDAFDITTLSGELTAAELSALLGEGADLEVPAHDAWGGAYEYRWSEDTGSASAIAIRSCGRDGRCGGPTYSAGPYDPSTDDDIVWADGLFVAFPAPAAPEESAMSEPASAANPETNEGKQQLALEQMRLVGAAWVLWCIDQTDEAPSKAGPATPVAFHAIGRALDFEELFSELHPSDEFFYLEKLPWTDPWGLGYEFLRAEDLDARPLMGIRSCGRDGVCSDVPVAAGPSAPGAYDDDIVWVDGFFVAYPDGVEGADLMVATDSR